MANVLGTSNVLGMNADKQLGSEISEEKPLDYVKKEKVADSIEKPKKKTLKLFRWKIGDACFCD